MAKLSNEDYTATSAEMRENMERMAARLGYYDFSRAMPRESRPDRLAQLRHPIEKYLTPVDPQATWDSVIGNDLAKRELREAIEASTIHADTYAFYDMKPPAGVLLYGPPGCGKTMFAKATASALRSIYGGETELIILNAVELQGSYVNETEARIRAIFAYAREYRKVKGHPLTIFIDEADSFLPPRGQGYRYQDGNVATFLAEMDGVKENNGAFIILATNRPDNMDQALLRDGRIDRKIKVRRPTYDDAQRILLSQLESGPKWVNSLSVADTCNALFSPELRIQELINPTTQRAHFFNLSHILSGAMIVGLLSRAKGFAFRRDIEAHGGRMSPSGVSQQDILAAIAEVYAENKTLNHDYALREFVEEVALPAEVLRNLN